MHFRSPSSSLRIGKDYHGPNLKRRGYLWPLHTVRGHTHGGLFLRLLLLHPVKPHAESAASGSKPDDMPTVFVCLARAYGIGFSAPCCQCVFWTADLTWQKWHTLEPALESLKCRTTNNTNNTTCKKINNNDNNSNSGNSSNNVESPEHKDAMFQAADCKQVGNAPWLFYLSSRSTKHWIHKKNALRGGGGTMYVCMHVCMYACLHACMYGYSALAAPACTDAPDAAISMPGAPGYISPVPEAGRSSDISLE